MKNFAYSRADSAQTAIDQISQNANAKFLAAARIWLT